MSSKSDLEKEFTSVSGKAAKFMGKDQPQNIGWKNMLLNIAVENHLHVFLMDAKKA